MNETHWCEDKLTLVDYLYGELDADSRRVFEGHLRTCVPCAVEVERLQGVRSELTEWVPPELQLGFTVVPTQANGNGDSAHPVRAAEPATVLRPPRWSWSATPAWARAAAAVFLLGAGLGFANLQVRSDANGFSVSTGWMRPAPPAPAAASARTTPVSLDGGAESRAWQSDLAALEATLRRDMEAIRTDHTGATPASRVSADDQVSLRRVQTLIADSERRQDQEMARRLSQFAREAEMVRRTDLVRLEQGFGRVEAQRGAQAVRQQQMLDYLYRVSTSKVP